MRRVYWWFSLGLAALACSRTIIGQETAFTPTTIPAVDFHRWAPTPPMGWNSWDCFGTAVNEEQVLTNAQYMAEKLAKHGWQYIVIDAEWFDPGARGFNYRKGARMEMDGYGRLMPAANRFPSAADGNGFKSLAKAIHDKGLKFGIHLMRGIPRQAVEDNTPILRTPHHAADIADKAHPCSWNPDMWGVDMTKPGAQEYYDSVFALIASWDVDYIKVDDLSRPYEIRLPEVEAVRRAIDKTGRPMVLSMSPGPTAMARAEHAAAHANMWRISDDFWDTWRLLKPQFKRCKDWAPYTGAGHYADADMLPFGQLRVGQPNSRTRFTPNEQYTVMTLWAICRSPLMMGGNLPASDDFTLSLLTNDEVLAVNQTSARGHELFRKDDLIAWVADDPNSSDKYLAVFNARDKPAESDQSDETITVELKDLGFDGPCEARDLWRKASLGTFSGQFTAAVPYHGAALYRLSTSGR